MAAFFRHPLIRTLPVGGAAVLGILLFLLVAAIPGAWLESLLSGIGALAPGAEPPLSTAARLLLALATGIVAATLGWATLYLLFGPGGPFAAIPVRSGPRADGVQTVRRADAHPDAPPRRPLSAAHELAAPPAPAVTLEQPLPADLDVPLATIDPRSILPVPREPVRPVPPLAPIFAPGERLETFALTPIARPAEPVPASDEPPSIDALLRRLEEGAERRAVRTR